MKNNLTSLIFILFLILIIMLIIMNIQKEPEKFTPSDYENITSNIITNVDNPVNCFDACDKNPDCDGVSLVKNKETNNYDCVLGLKSIKTLIEYYSIFSLPIDCYTFTELKCYISSKNFFCA